MSSVTEVTEETLEAVFPESDRPYEDRRTPEQIAALRLKQLEVSARYRPLARKATEQLRRAEAAFLAANDSTIGTQSEADAIANLFVAQNVAQYYKHALLDVGYAYNVKDLRIHEDNYNGE